VVGGDGRFFMTDAVDIIIKESSNYGISEACTVIAIIEKKILVPTVVEVYEYQ
jgi:hypothetical protein